MLSKVKSHNFCNYLHITTILFALALLTSCVATKRYDTDKLLSSGDFDSNKTKLTSYIAGKKLAAINIPKRAINDAFTRKFLTTYLQELDKGKKIFLQQDVSFLEEMLHSENSFGVEKKSFPIIVDIFLQERVNTAINYISEIVVDDFNFYEPDVLETAPDKLDFCSTKEELRERWRVTIKNRILYRYFHLLNEKHKDANASYRVGGSIEEDLMVTATRTIKRWLTSSYKNISKDHKKEKFNIFLNSLTKTYNLDNYFIPPQNSYVSTPKSLFVEEIGATLTERGGFIYVARLNQSSRAHRENKLKKGDKLLMFAQADGEFIDLLNMPLDDVAELIKDQSWTKIKFIKNNINVPEEEIILTREKGLIEENFVKCFFVKSANHEKLYGYIKIFKFYRDFTKEIKEGEGRNSYDDVKKNLYYLKTRNVAGLILDLRDCTGGVFDEAVKITSLFIGKGPVVCTKRTEGESELIYNGTEPMPFFLGPLVVLVNKKTAAGAEIVAGALQDYKRAVIFGSTKTYGRGSVQTLFNLDQYSSKKKYKPLGHLAVTTSNFYRISGMPFQLLGVTPDIILPISRFDQHIISNYQAATNSLAPKPIPSIDFKKWRNPPDFSLIINKFTKTKTGTQLYSSRADKLNTELSKMETAIQVSFAEIGAKIKNKFNERKDFIRSNNKINILDYIETESTYSKPEENDFDIQEAQRLISYM